MGSQVQETNDFSIVSKLSMVSSGYFDDTYLQFLSPKYKRRSPLINIGYCVRAVVVNKGINVFLETVKNMSAQIVSLGAGFDSTYFRAVSELKNITYFEVDFPDVVNNKIALIKNSEQLYNKLIEPKECEIGLLSKYYILVSQDMSNIYELQQSLLSAGLDSSKPTLFFSECAITYMDEVTSRNIINWASSFDDVMFLIYEQISCGSGFSQVMLSHFEGIDSPLKSLEKCHTKEEQINRYKTCGYEYAVSVGAFEVFKGVLPIEKYEHILKLEPFDEWEEWHTTSNHYTLSAGINGLCIKNYSDFIGTLNLIEKGDNMSLRCDWDFNKEVTLQFFGHSALLIWNSSALLVVGGFGVSSDNKHKRCTQLCLISVPDFKATYLTPPSIEGICWDCMHHTCSIISDCTDETKFLLYGGRTSPVRSVNCVPFSICISRKNGEIMLSGRKLEGEVESSPHPRRRHSATNINGKTFLFGGIFTDSSSLHHKIFGDAWLLTEQETWRRINSKMTARFSHSAAFYNGIVYIAGGIGENFEPLGDIWSFNISDNVWARLERNIVPLYSHTSHVYKDFLLLVGGINHLSEKQPGICIINLSNGSIKNYNFPDSSKELPIMVHNHVSFIMPASEGLYIIGGGGNCFSFGTSFNKYPTILKLDSICINK